MEKNKITGIILAGGKSSRMGTDKGEVLLKEKKLIEHVLEAVSPVTNSIFIIANNNNYNYLGYPVYRDLIKDCGPIGGIYTGLMHSETEQNLILSCDTPLINTELLNYIILNRDDSEITVAENQGKIEPLCALYSKKCAEKFKELIKQNEFKITHAMSFFNTKRVPISEKQDFYSERLFFNINTPLDLQELEDRNNDN